MCFNQLGRLARSNGLDFGDVVIEPNTCTHALYFSVFEEHVSSCHHTPFSYKCQMWHWGCSAQLLSCCSCTYNRAVCQNTEAS